MSRHQSIHKTRIVENWRRVIRSDASFYISWLRRINKRFERRRRRRRLQSAPMQSKFLREAPADFL